MINKKAVVLCSLRIKASKAQQAGRSYQNLPNEYLQEKSVIRVGDISIYIQ